MNYSNNKDKAMEENKKDKIEGEVRISTPFTERVENFWYHYKWHTIVGVAVVLILAIIIGQFVTQEKYDVYIMYAGGEAISRKSEGGDIPEYNRLTNALAEHADDYDGDGRVSVALSDLFIMSPEEYADFGSDADYSSMREDTKTLSDRLAYSEYYVLLISKHVYDNYHERSGTEIFAPISRYCPEGNSFVFEGDNAVYLSSTPLYSLPAFAGLPEDTLICIRINSEVSAMLGRKKNAEIYRRSQEYLTSLLSYTGE